MIWMAQQNVAFHIVILLCPTKLTQLLLDYRILVLTFHYQGINLFDAMFILYLYMYIII